MLKRRAENQHSLSSFFQAKQTAEVPPEQETELSSDVDNAEHSSSTVATGGVRIVFESGGESREPSDSRCEPRSTASSANLTEYNQLVSKALSGVLCTDREKCVVIDGRAPQASAKLPFSLVRNQRKQSGFSKCYLQRQYFDNFDWLGYHDGDDDLDKAGVFCVACSLFPAIHRDGSRRADYLVSKIQTNFKTNLRNTMSQVTPECPSPTVHPPLNTSGSPSCSQSFCKITASPVAFSQSSCRFLNFLLLPVTSIGAFSTDINWNKHATALPTI